MAGDRSRYGLVISALGAIVLGISVFLPWYGVSLTATGIAYIQEVSGQLVAQYGNASLQSYMAGLHGTLDGLAGQQVAALSAHQILHELNVILLALVVLGLLDTLLALARPVATTPAGAGASVVVLGALAAMLVLYRMIDRPSPAGPLLSLSLREGAWLALLGALSMVVGGLWPRVKPATSASEAQLRGAWSGLSGWTPGA
ncbi:MAG: hypothetical protein H0X28_03345 [Solirubrobacterales bacterium]|nr:hypothetical protein [Solirubrobacterales bacterium]